MIKQSYMLFINNNNIPSVFPQVEFGRVECPKTLPLSHGDREAQVTHNKSVRKRQCRGRTRHSKK
uniref:Putative ovule protein n=1 Tax=Solanum chacoense TaxID=4108 RepID=A0A0V0GYE7_SOLCH